ncbi:helix-turn-helix domain-containing protein [Achromobacter insolitus]|uniref:helix-turn-helix domain-containing protein n=1 Tax=Achromobacter insolitus TaxID=217204 RepID=UPI00244E904B|nr:helix-turn-helix domain-containing protein [Achromobacter insolitus]MDH3062063.1 helix-turn-helix domain-containing protein [Achromobacter insolitus]
MREVLDCGVLLAPGHEGAMRDLVARHPARQTRVRLHLVSLSPIRYAAAGQAPEGDAAAAGVEAPVDSPAAGADVQALARLAVALKRYDCCILPVAPASLSWARTALQQAQPALATPVLLLISDVKAPAIEDLLNLGASDFVAQPVCLESLRVRLGRLASHAHRRGVPQAGIREPAAAYRESAPRPGTAGAQRPGVLRARVSPDLVEQTLAGWRHQHLRAAHESFRTAKARVVDGFERDYIRLALSRHGGNVAQAARACCKHRRAFWALMRKHGIEAAPYRQAAQEREA